MRNLVVAAAVAAAAMVVMGITWGGGRLAEEGPSGSRASTAPGLTPTTSPSSPPESAASVASPPGPGSTGPRLTSAELHRSGSVKVTEPGAVVEGLDISGTLVIDADDVTVRDVRVRSSAPFPVRVMGGRENVLVEHCEVDAEGSAKNNAAIMGSNVTVRHCEIHSANDGGKVGSNSLWEHNWIHSPTHAPGSDAKHTDGLQSTGGSNIVIRRNLIDMYLSDEDFPGNSAIIIAANKQPLRDVVIAENWLNGGNYTVFLLGADEAEGIELRDNRFGEDHRHGPVHATAQGATILGNVWDQTGQPLSSSEDAP